MPRNSSQPTVIVKDSRSCSEMGMQNGIPFPIDESAFASWLATAAAGERLVYHVGHLGFDRSFGSQLPPARRRSLDRVANRVFALADLGSLVLAQKRLGDGCVAYLAIKAVACRPEAA